MSVAKPKTLEVSRSSEVTFQARAPENKLDRTPNSNCSFLVDLADIQSMKQNLQDLLSSFRAGQLQAFGEKDTLEQMENIRSMQGKLARLHFGLSSQVDFEDIEDSAENSQLHEDNMAELLENLDDVGTTIKSLNPQATVSKKESEQFSFSFS